MKTDVSVRNRRLMNIKADVSDAQNLNTGTSSVSNAKTVQWELTIRTRTKCAKHAHLKHHFGTENIA